MSNQRSGDLRPGKKERFAKLPTEMQTKIGEFELGLHGVRESTKVNYLGRIEWFAGYLVRQGIQRFQDAGKKDIDLFLSGYKNNNTKNLFVQVLRTLYKDLKPEVVAHLKIYEVELEEITPSELLTVEEVVALATEAGKRRELYKYFILALFESCARISEVINLRVGDCVFSSVTGKDGKRGLIATLHFKRSKGKNKQPVTLVMFAADLKRWVDGQKGDEQAYLFPSPRNPSEPISIENMEEVTWDSGARLGLKKRCNPHWFRHSGLSFFANSLGHPETLLMVRAGWASSQMARRYVHTGAEIEKRQYLAKMGYQLDEKEDKKILPKTCFHCQALNPYTNTHCDTCAYPLDAKEYEREIERKQNTEQLYKNLQQIGTGKLTEEQEKELQKRTDTVLGLLELGRDDLAKEYISTLLEHWTKAFLVS